MRYGAPNPADPNYHGLPVTRPGEATAAAEAIVLATPWRATKAAVKGLADHSRLMLVDSTNPLGMGLDGLGLMLGFDTSAGEQMAGWAQGARGVEGVQHHRLQRLGVPRATG